MPNIKIIDSIVKENGLNWAINRTLYTMKLKSMQFASFTEKFYEKKTDYPKRLNIFDIDVLSLQKYIRSLDSDSQRELIKTADMACDGIIRGFSSVELNYGNPIDWQLNPLTGKKCNIKYKWYSIPDFDKERGDIKVIWEASRFSHFVTLARAYLLTGQKKYYEAFRKQLKSWLDDNPYGYGANFKCGQECSLRMVNALLAYTVFEKSGIATDVDKSCIKDLVDRCYRKVLSNFFYAYKCIRNNHTISELMGMIVGAWCCDNQDQIQKAYKMLDKVIDEQFTDDGGYKQFSFNYQRLALQDLEIVLSISDKTGLDLCNRSKTKLKNSAYLMYQCQDTSSDMPNYGFNDGALAFPVSACGYRDFRSVINTAYALSSGEQLYDADKHQEELLWFSAGKQLVEYKRSMIIRRSSQFLDAGLFTLRGDHSWGMVVSNDYRSRPAHMDQLHFDLWIDGENVLCDSGTYSYASMEGSELSKNERHNTAVVENKQQMGSLGTFLMYDWTRRDLGLCNEICFSGRMNSQNGYTHVREVKQNGLSYEITDMVDRNYSVLFHTPCDVVLEDGNAVLFKGGKLKCVIQSTGKIEVRLATRSLYYLQKECINCLSISGIAGTSILTTIIVKNKGELEE